MTYVERVRLDDFNSVPYLGPLEPSYRTFAEVTPRAVRWLVDGLIPLGTSTIFAGIGGLGKSTLLMQIAAQVTRDGGSVIVVSYEDTLEEILRPRAEAAGAHLSRMLELVVPVEDGGALCSRSLVLTEPCSLRIGRAPAPARSPMTSTYRRPSSSASSNSIQPGRRRHNHRARPDRRPRGEAMTTATRTKDDVKSDILRAMADGDDARVKRLQEEYRTSGFPVIRLSPEPPRLIEGPTRSRSTATPAAARSTSRSPLADVLRAPALGTVPSSRLTVVLTALALDSLRNSAYDDGLEAGGFLYGRVVGDEIRVENVTEVRDTRRTSTSVVLSRDHLDLWADHSGRPNGGCWEIGIPTHPSATRLSPPPARPTGSGGGLAPNRPGRSGSACSCSRTGCPNATATCGVRRRGPACGSPRRARPSHRLSGSSSKRRRREQKAQHAGRRLGHGLRQAEVGAAAAALLCLRSWPPLKVTVTDPVLLPDLLAFVRGAGCFAYYEGRGIEVVRPHLFGAKEARAVRTIVRRWWDEHPEAQVEMHE